MLRRNVRIRKEYLYRKGLEEREQTISQRKRQLQDAIQQNKSIPTELRKRREDAKLKKKLDLTDVITATPKTHIDDEYGNAASRDPKLLVTTSRDPSASLTRFTKEIALLFPTAQRVNRGQYGVDDLLHLSQTNDVTDIILIHEHRGVPDGLVVSHLPFGPTAYFSLTNVVMRHDLQEKPEAMSEAPPHLIFHNFTSQLGLRVRSILRYLFPPSKHSSNRVVTFANSQDVIHFRNHTWRNLRADKQRQMDNQMGQEGPFEQIGGGESLPMTSSSLAMESVNRNNPTGGGGAESERQHTKKGRRKGATSRNEGGEGGENGDTGTGREEASLSSAPIIAHTENAKSGVPHKVEDVGLTEIGPRMSLKLYRIDLGTVGMKDVESEWTLKPFMNSQKTGLESKCESK